MQISPHAIEYANCTMKAMICIPRLAVGGIASMALEYADGLKMLGYETGIVTLYDTNEELKTLGQEIHNLGIKPRDGFLMKILSNLRRLSKIWSLVIVNRPSFILTLDPLSFLFALSTKIINPNSKIVAGLYTPIPQLRMIDRLIVNYFYMFANRLIAPSEAAGKQASLQAKSIKFEILPCPLSARARICAWPRSLTLDVPKYLYFGRVSREKEAHKILTIAIQNPQLNFGIAGDGPLRAELESKVDLENIKNVSFLGWTTPSDLFPLAKFMIVPSQYETFGTVIIEAAIHGVPSIALSCADGPRELVEKYNLGTLINDTGSTAEWNLALTEISKIQITSASMKAILEDHDSYMRMKKLLGSF